MEKLIEELKYKGVLKSKNIEKALLAVDRAYFVHPEYKEHAYVDTALPIGHDQTISQPYTVVFMLEKLEIKEGMSVLDVGYGSGWQSALLASLVGKSGSVYSMEVIPELSKFGKINISRFTDLQKRIEFYCQNAKEGLPDIADFIGGFDRIISAASLNAVPTNWREQLKTGGIMVYPKEYGIYKEIKLGQNKFDIEFYKGFVFVPFVEE